MKERGEQRRQAGCQNLKDYNRENPNHKMPRLILLVDECHALFKDGRHKIQKEIDQIIEQIAKEEGRSRKKQCEVFLRKMIADYKRKRSN